MMAIRTWASRLGVAVAFSSLGMVGCSTAQGDAENQPANDNEPVVKVVNVEIVVVEPTIFSDYIRVTGEVEAFRDITLSAEETGAIESFLVEKGEYVAQGAVIARLDNDILAALVDEARAAAALAAEQYERQRRLWEDEGIGSEIAYLQARFQGEIQQARVATLEARLAKTEIRAPFAGVFDERFLDEGEMAAPGTPVARMVSIDRLKIAGGVPERFAPSVHRGDRAVITFDVLEGWELNGRIDYVGSSVDDRSRTFPVEIVITNPGGVIKPRMVANVLLERARLEGVAVVRQDVVVRTEQGYRVYVAVDRDGVPHAEARDVVLGPSYRDRVVVESGLAFGDRLVVAGAQLVDAGNRLRIVGNPADDDPGA
jgi:RND family efflux transporter MFP subunit